MCLYQGLYFLIFDSHAVRVENGFSLGSFFFVFFSQWNKKNRIQWNLSRNLLRKWHAMKLNCSEMLYRYFGNIRSAFFLLIQSLNVFFFCIGKNFSVRYSFNQIQHDIHINFFFVIEVFMRFNLSRVLPKIFFCCCISFFESIDVKINGKWIIKKK